MKKLCTKTIMIFLTGPSHIFSSLLTLHLLTLSKCINQVRNIKSSFIELCSQCLILLHYNQRSIFGWWWGFRDRLILTFLRMVERVQSSLTFKSGHFYKTALNYSIYTDSKLWPTMVRKQYYLKRSFAVDQRMLLLAETNVAKA